MIEQFWATLDELGEKAVLDSLHRRQWGEAGPHFEFAKEWLRRKDLERVEVFQREQTEIARSASEAAWTSARAATAANTKSNVALIFAGIAALASMAAVIVPIFVK